MADDAGQGLKSRVSAEEWQARVDLAALYRLVAMHGWDDMIFTHISVRVPVPEHHFLINPYGLLFEEITAFPLTNVEIDEVLAGVKGLLDGGINDILVFYYPRDWRMGEIIWTPVAEKVLPGMTMSA